MKEAELKRLVSDAGHRYTVAQTALRNAKKDFIEHKNNLAEYYCPFTSGDIVEGAKGKYFIINIEAGISIDGYEIRVRKFRKNGSLSEVDKVLWRGSELNDLRLIKKSP